MKKVLISISLFLVSLSLYGCDNSYEETLDSGLEKYYSGEKMTEQEHDAVESYHDWIDDNKEKTYDAWD